MRKRIVILIVAGLFILPVMSMGHSVFEGESLEALVLGANDLAIDIDGFTKTTAEYSSADDFNMVFLYQLYETPYAQIKDNMLFDESPNPIILVKYVSDDGWRGFIEIFEYDTEQAASDEYEDQKDAVEGGTRSIYSRYSLDDNEELLYQQAQFLFFAYGELGRETKAAHNSDFLDLFSIFLENAVNLIADDNIPAAPDVSYSGEIVWGIQIGDRMKWEYTGSFNDPYSASTYGPDPIEVEIADFSDDNLAVLIMDYQTSLSIHKQDPSYSIRLGGDYEMDYWGLRPFSCYIYTWWTADDDVFLAGDTRWTFTSLVYPLYHNGLTLLGALRAEISFLPEETLLTGGDYFSVSGRTSSGMGYTPLKTMWLDITAHKGAGIVSSGSWYYNDNEYSFVRTDAITLVEHNINLELRTPFVPTPTTTPATSGTTPVEPTSTTTPEEAPPPSQMILVMGGVGVTLVVIVLIIIKKR